MKILSRLFPYLPSLLGTSTAHHRGPAATYSLAALAALFAVSLALTGGARVAKASPRFQQTNQPTIVATSTAQTSGLQASEAQPRPGVISIQQAGLGEVIVILVVGGFILFIPAIFGGLVVIGEKEVGIVIKKFEITGKSLPPGHLIAMDNEPGYQADTLSPGWHWFYWPWQYSVIKEPVIMVPQGEIGLVVAADGAEIPSSRIMGRLVDCDNFQDARKFLRAKGEKGRQLGFLTAGTYRINTALFTVIIAANASKNGMTPQNLQVHTVDPDAVGIVTTMDGIPIEGGEIAGPVIGDHDNFQNGQKFIEGGGRRGLQEQVILSGSWNLNPWFAKVEQVPMTEIPIGYVGVVISYVGKAAEDVSGASFTHGNLVQPGHKGVWVTPLYPGKHAINTKIMKVELVPTTNIVLNWSGRVEEHGYDSKLSTLTVCSRDGFSFNLAVSQIIHVGALDAPKVISRVGAMQNLVDHVLQPIVGNYFRNSAQAYTVLDYLIARSERQAEAAEYIRTALRAYDVQAVDTLLGEIVPPKELMQTLTDRKIAEEQQKTYDVQRIAQSKRQELVRETSLADIQKEMVKAEQGVQIADLQANARVKEASGEAESIRVTGRAQAEAYRAGVIALGAQSYTALQLMQVIGDRKVRVVPDVSVSGGTGGSGGLVDALLGMLVLSQNGKMTHQNGDATYDELGTEINLDLPPIAAVPGLDLPHPPSTPG